MPDDAIVERLDLILAVLQLAHHDAIERARERLRADPVSAAILDTAGGEEWVATAELQREVNRLQPSASQRTIQRRVRDLVTGRALAERGAGPAKAYRSTGLI
jgi:hypothetical protein